MIVRILQIISFVTVMAYYTNAMHITGDADLSNSTQKNFVIDGAASLKNMHFEALKINGSVKFENLTISKTLQIKGAVKGKELKCESLHVMGACKVESVSASTCYIMGAFNGNHVQINGNSEIYGDFFAENSKFQDVEIQSEQAVLKNVETRNILIKINNNKNEPQKLILEGNTLIMGDIKFESGNGEIYKDKKVQIKGKIEGVNRIIE